MLTGGGSPFRSRHSKIITERFGLRATANRYSPSHRLSCVSTRRDGERIGAETRELFAAAAVAFVYVFTLFHFSFCFYCFPLRGPVKSRLGELGFYRTPTPATEGFFCTMSVSDSRRPARFERLFRKRRVGGGGKRGETGGLNVVSRGTV